MSTIAAAEATGRQTLDIGLVFKQAWRLFVKDIGALLIGALIVAALSAVTLGILAGPLAAGLYGMVVKRVRDGRQAEVGDVFGQMHRFGSFFVAALVLVLLIGLASLTIVGGVVLATIWLYVFPLMVDRGMDLGEAMKTSKDMVVQAGFWEHLALVILLVALNAIADGPLVLLSVPFTIATLAAAYYVADGRGDLVERV